MTLELVGVAEVAEILGVARGSIASYLNGTASSLPPAPPPVAELHCGRIWLRSEIEAWAHGRKTHGRYRIRQTEHEQDGERLYGLWDTIERCYVNKYGEPDPKYACTSRAVAQMRRRDLNR